MQWGLGTITHAQTAQSLWRDGIKDYTLCGTRQRTPNTAELPPDSHGAPHVAVQSAAAAVDDDQAWDKDAAGHYADPLLLAADMPADDGVSSLATAEPGGGGPEQASVEGSATDAAVAIAAVSAAAAK